MGFWAALAEVYPETRAQRCWVHKTVNVLDKQRWRKLRGFRQLGDVIAGATFIDGIYKRTVSRKAA